MNRKYAVRHLTIPDHPFFVQGDDGGQEFLVLDGHGPGRWNLKQLFNFDADNTMKRYWAEIVCCVAIAALGPSSIQAAQWIILKGKVQADIDKDATAPEKEKA